MASIDEWEFRTSARPMLTGYHHVPIMYIPLHQWRKGSGLNKTETLTYGWLQRQGYQRQDISFHYRTSPDFRTADGLGWETKLARNRSVYFTPSQKRALHGSNVSVVIFEPNKPQPSEVVAFDKLRVPGRHGPWTLITPSDESVRDTAMLSLRVSRVVAEMATEIARNQGYLNLNSAIRELLRRYCREEIKL